MSEVKYVSCDTRLPPPQVGDINAWPWRQRCRITTAVEWLGRTIWTDAGYSHAYGGYNLTVRPPTEEELVEYLARQDRSTPEQARERLARHRGFTDNLDQNLPEHDRWLLYQQAVSAGVLR